MSLAGPAGAVARPICSSGSCLLPVPAVGTLLRRSLPGRPACLPRRTLARRRVASMLDLISGPATARPGSRLSRRAFLRIGALGLGGLTLADLLRLQARASVTGAAAHKAVIMVYLPGGPSHIDMYDMKPDAPGEIRGKAARPARHPVSRAGHRHGADLPGPPRPPAVSARRWRPDLGAGLTSI